MVNKNPATENLDMDADSGENISPIGSMGATPSTTLPGSSGSATAKLSDAKGSAKLAAAASHKEEKEEGFDAEELSMRAKQYYEDASHWMRDNQNAVYIAVGAVAAVGMAFYFISRRMGGEESSSRFDRASA